MPEYSRVALHSAFGIQHAEDEYYFRPLILGDNLFTYVAHIPPGGGVPPYPEAAQHVQVEHTLYVLQGTIKVTLLGESVTLVPHTALHLPAGEAIEMRNEGQSTATIYMAYVPFGDLLHPMRTAEGSPTSMKCELGMKSGTTASGRLQKWILWLAT